MKKTLLLIFVLSLSVGGLLPAADWGDPVAVAHEGRTAVSYRATLESGYLIVEATPGEGWHTFAMDNELRANEALAGKMSLGVDMPTRIEPAEGVAIEGPWRQSEPKDFSNPDLRWYSWGYEQPALFAAKASTSGPDAAVSVRGQACSDTTCKNINVLVPVSSSSEAGELEAAIARLIPLKTDDGPAPANVD